MKSSLLYFLVTITSFALACGGKSPTNSGDEPFSLSIEVTNSAGDPVPGIRISAWNQLEFVPDPPPPLPTALAPIGTASLLGDINCNGVAFEQVDLDDLKQFFVLGDSAFLGHVACSRANSDLNQDGVAPTLSDLVWLMRIVVGVGPPQGGTADSVDGRFGLDGGWLSVADSLPISALTFTTVNRNTSIIVQNDSIEMISHFDPIDFVTRTLLTPKRSDSNSLGSFTSLLLSRVTGGCCTGEIAAATVQGMPVRFREVFGNGISNLLHPSPSSDKFTIDFEFLREGIYHLDFRDMENNILQEFDDTVDVGLVRIEWKPPSPHNAFYKWNLKTHAFGSGFGMLNALTLFWSSDPGANILGTTDRFGRYNTIDSLRFPSTFGSRITNLDSNSTRIGTVRPLEATTISVSDPRTGRSHQYQSSIGKGKNVIRLIWDWPF